MIKVKNGWVNFYPTYEALKQCVNATTGNADWDDFYPTYEALKRNRYDKFLFGLSDFYPTYEALKLYVGNQLLIVQYEFLPYL